MHIKNPTESHLASAPSRGALCCGCWLCTCLVFVQDSWSIDLRWIFYINFSITGFIHRKTKNDTCLRAKLCVWDSPRRYFCFRSSLGHIARFHPCPLSLLRTSALFSVGVHSPLPATHNVKGTAPEPRMALHWSWFSFSGLNSPISIRTFWGFTFLVSPHQPTLLPFELGTALLLGWMECCAQTAHGFLEIPWPYSHT